MAKVIFGAQILLKNVIIGYPSLFTKKVWDQEDTINVTPKYEALFYLNNLEHQQEKNEIDKAILALKKANGVEDKQINLFYTRQNEKITQLEHIFNFSDGELPSVLLQIKATNYKEIKKFYNNEVLISEDDSEMIKDLSLVNAMIQLQYYDETKDNKKVQPGIKAVLLAVDVIKFSEAPRNQDLDYLKIFQDLKNTDNKHLEHYNNSVAALNFFE